MSAFLLQYFLIDSFFLMQKKIIFTFFGAFIFGILGGFVHDYFIEFFESESISTSIEAVDLSSRLVEAQKAVAPAVISIIKYSTIPSSPFFYYSDISLRQSGGGTGFIIDSSGIALTNKHVIGSSDDHYFALLPSGLSYGIDVLAIDPLNDLAILQLIPLEEGDFSAQQLGQLPFVELGRSSQLEVGDPVLAIGNALAEYNNTTTAGIISAKGRKLTASDGKGAFSELSGLLQTDAAINLGNSGGPLINLDGKVIGINTALDDGAQSIGFAIPIDDVIPALESWRLHGKILRPILGVHYVMLTEAMAYDLELNTNHGALLMSNDDESAVIVPGSSAEAAGLRSGDVILEVDGISIDESYTLQDAILHKPFGVSVPLMILREAAIFQIQVELTNAVLE